MVSMDRGLSIWTIDRQYQEGSHGGHCVHASGSDPCQMKDMCFMALRVDPASEGGNPARQVWSRHVGLLCSKEPSGVTGAAPRQGAPSLEVFRQKLRKHKLPKVSLYRNVGLKSTATSTISSNSKCLTFWDENSV